MAFNILFLSALTMVTPINGEDDFALKWNNPYKEQPEDFLLINNETLGKPLNTITLNDYTMFFECRYFGEVYFSTQEPRNYNNLKIAVDIDYNSPRPNPQRRILTHSLSQEDLSNNNIGKVRIPIKTLLNIEQLDRNTEVKISMFVDMWIVENQNPYFMYEACLNMRLNESIEESFLQGNDMGFNDGYSSGYEIGYNTGKNSVICPGVEEQNVFDLIKSAFKAPLELFNVQLMPGLTLGTLLLLPISIAVLFAIWRLLT